MNGRTRHGRLRLHPHVRAARAARAGLRRSGRQQAGFDFEVISDHYFPWLDAQGHAPNAWAVLGAVATATQRVPLMTYVTCPIMRYHPAVVAQQAATVALLAGDGRFVLGLGAGENLNEHVVGRGWPPANVRHEMLTEAVEIISRLFEGGYVSTDGRHYRVDSAKLGTCPRARVPIAVAVSGSQSVETFAPVADAMVATEPEASLVTGFDDAAGARLPSGSSRSRGVRTAMPRWPPPTSSSAGSPADGRSTPSCRGTAGFAAATQFVRPADVSSDPLRSGRRRARRGRPPVRRRRVHPRRTGADRWADPGRLRVVRGPGAAPGPARGVRQVRRRRRPSSIGESSHDRDPGATAPA